MALNLIRNARVFIATGSALNADGTLVATNDWTHTTSTNTFEVQVLQGITFSQNVNTQNITLNEAGATPVRGQQVFNTALNPADFSFQTYIRPVVAAGLVDASEKILWNAALSNQVIPTTITGVTAMSYATATGVMTITGAGFPTTLAADSYVTITGFSTAGTQDFNNVIKLTTQSTSGTIVGTYVNKPADTFVSPTYANVKLYAGPGWAAGFGVAGTASGCSTVATLGTDVHQLQKFAVIVVADSEAYVIQDSAVDQLTIDFGVDAIASISWTGKGTKIDAATVTPTLAALGTNVASGTGTALGYTSVNTAANFIQNKLSTVTLVSNIGGVAGTSYTVPITGGSLQIMNNLNYKTPENLGVVNIPIGYTTGTRAVSGTLNAYLRTGTAGDTGSLLSAISAGMNSATQTKYLLQVEIGGLTNTNRVELEVDGAMLSVPTIDAQDVISTSIAFTALGTAQFATTPGYDLAIGNELQVRYYAT